MLELIQNRINKIKRFFGITPKNKWLNYYTNMPKEIKYDDGSLMAYTQSTDTKTGKVSSKFTKSFNEMFPTLTSTCK